MKKFESLLSQVTKKTKKREEESVQENFSDIVEDQTIDFENERASEMPESQERTNEKNTVETHAEQEVDFEKMGDMQMREDQEKIKSMQENIKAIDDKEIIDSKIAEEIKKEKIQKYIKKHLPEHLQNGEASAVYKIFRGISKMALKEVIGKEKLPEGEKLFIANHRGGESGRLMAALDDPVHIASAEKINWENDKVGAFRWVMKKLGMVPVRESFSYLDEGQRERVVEKSRTSEKAAHQKAVEGVKNLGGGNIENIRGMVALLLSGENVAIFTEGAFSRLEEDERKSYAGYALVAREYKRTTGRNLNIVPTGIRNNKVVFDDTMHIDQGGRQSKEDLQDIATEKIHALYDSLE